MHTSLSESQVLTNCSSASNRLLENDDNTERARRRLSRRLEASAFNSQTLQTQPTVSEETNFLQPDKKLEKNELNANAISFQANSVNSSSMPNGLTHDQLKEIYSNCIRLASENKINVKNAFGLQLIDCMQDLVVGSKPDFQIAGCTLDASVKIYSYRVDSVHNEAIRVAGTLNNNNVEIDDAEEENEGPRAEKNVEKAKKRKVQSKIETNLKNITINKTCENARPSNMNTVFKPNGLVLEHFPETHIVETLQVANDQFHNESYCLDDYVIFKQYTSMNEENKKTIANLMKDLAFVKMDKKKCIGYPLVYPFNFSSWKHKNVDNADDLEALTGINFNNLNEQTEQIEKTEQNNIVDDFGDLADTSFGNAVSETTNDANDNIKFDFPNVSQINVTENNTLALNFSLKSDQFSYFKNLNTTRRILNDKNIDNKANEKLWRTLQEKSLFRSASAEFDPPNRNIRKRATLKSKNKKISEEEDSLLNFDEALTEANMKRLKSSKLATVSKQTVAETSNSKYLQNDSNIEVEEEIFQLFIMPSVSFCNLKNVINPKNMEAEDDESPPAAYVDVDGDYDYGNVNDSVNYCALNKSNKVSSFNEEQEVVVQEKLHHFGVVPSKEINFVKQAKRFDPKQIKQVLWEDLQQDQSEEKQAGTKFSTTFKNMKKNLPEKSQEAVSVPIAMACLLHLAYEKDFELETEDGGQDLKIILRK